MEIKDSHIIEIGSKLFPFMPFLLILNKKGIVLGAGPSIIKSIESNPIGSSIDETFEMKRPQTWAELPCQLLEKYIIFFKHRKSGLEFKGQVVHYNQDYSLLAINPLVSGQMTVKDFHLSLGDFPVFDTIAEYLFLKQTNTNSLKEAEVLNSILLDKNKLLNRAKEELSSINSSLEKKVQERTEEIESALDLLQKAQQEIISREKMSMLGQLVSGIAHEINTPLGSIKASAFNLKFTVDYILNEGAIKLDMQSRLLIRNYYLNGVRKEIPPHESYQLKKTLTVLTSDLYPHIAQPMQFASAMVEAGIDSLDHPFIQAIIYRNDCKETLKVAVELNQLFTGLSTIELAADRASKVVQALKTYVHTSEVSIQKSFNLREQIDSVLILFTHDIRRGIEVKNDIDKDVFIVADPDQIAQVWTNLVSNAIHAIHEDGNIIFTSEKSNSSYIIKVSNDGPEIPSHVIPKIFDPFFTTKERGMGTGLGLNIIKKIIEHHQGNIHCESSPEMTTFTVTFPIR
jgi:two-component system NtrC family sensor kinase